MQTSLLWFLTETSPSAYFKIISLFIHWVNSVSTCREPLKRDGFQKGSEIRVRDKKKKCKFVNTSKSDTGWLTKQLAMASDSTLESQLLLLVGVEAGCWSYSEKNTSARPICVTHESPQLPSVCDDYLGWSHPIPNFESPSLSAVVSSILVSWSPKPVYWTDCWERPGPGL